MIRSNNSGPTGVGNYAPACIDVFGPDGKPKKTPLVNNLGTGDCGLGVNAAGNVYVGVNVKPNEQPVPDAFMGKVSADPFVWWRRATATPRGITCGAIPTCSN